MIEQGKKKTKLNILEEKLRAGEARAEGGRTGVSLEVPGAARRALQLTKLL